MRYIVTGIFVALISVALIAYLSEAINEEEYGKVAHEVLERSSEELGFSLDAFEFISASWHDGGIIYAWRAKARPEAQIGVTVSRFDDDFWSKPILINCQNDRLATIYAFGEVCRN